jgi:hypothetical protein
MCGTTTKRPSLAIVRCAVVLANADVLNNAVPAVEEKEIGIAVV